VEGGAAAGHYVGWGVAGTEGQLECVPVPGAGREGDIPGPGRILETSGGVGDAVVVGGARGLKVEGQTLEEAGRGQLAAGDERLGIGGAGVGVGGVSGGAACWIIWKMPGLLPSRAR